MTEKEARLTTEIVPVAMEPVGYVETTGVPLEYSWKSLGGRNTASLVGDVGGAAIGRDHDAVRDVTDVDLRNLDGFRGGQVDLGQRIVDVNTE